MKREDISEECEFDKCHNKPIKVWNEVYLCYDHYVQSTNHEVKLFIFMKNTSYSNEKYEKINNFTPVIKLASLTYLGNKEREFMFPITFTLREFFEFINKTNRDINIDSNQLQHLVIESEELKKGGLGVKTYCSVELCNKYIGTIFEFVNNKIE